MQISAVSRFEQEFLDQRAVGSAHNSPGEQCHLYLDLRSHRFRQRFSIREHHPRAPAPTRLRFRWPARAKRSFADLAISPTIVNFGNLALKSTSTQNVTLQNTGDINLSLQGVTVSGTGFGYSESFAGLFSRAESESYLPGMVLSQGGWSCLRHTVAVECKSFFTGDTQYVWRWSVFDERRHPPTNPQHAAHGGPELGRQAPAKSSGIVCIAANRQAGSYSPLNGTAITALNYSDSTVASGNTYYYVVTAVDSSGDESVYSNQATAVIPYRLPPRRLALSRRRFCAFC